MSLNSSITKTEVIFYGKKVFYLDRNLAQKIQPEQIRMNFKQVDNKTETIH